MSFVPGGSGGVLLTPPPQHWECRCGRTAVTPASASPTSRLHPCPLSGGLLTPYAPAGVRAKVTVAEREDYEQHSGLSANVGESLTRTDAGLPIMRITTEYGDTSATVLFVPCIEINLGAQRG